MEQPEHDVSWQRYRSLLEELDEWRKAPSNDSRMGGIGFIDTGNGKDFFFHSSKLDGVSYDDLHEGQQVSYSEGSRPKGPCAEDVKRT